MKSVEVRKVPRMGRGVFAKKAFAVDSVIEECPVILFDNKEGSGENLTREYSFRWNRNKVAISLGYGSLYNHSYEPNARVVQDLKGMQMVVECVRPIKKGEQILINYNGEVDCKDELWFASR